MIKLQSLETRRGGGSLTVCCRLLAACAASVSLSAFLDACPAAAAALGLACATAGGVFEAEDFFPKKEEMSRCFMLQLGAPRLSLMICLLSNSLHALCSVLRADNMHQTTILNYFVGLKVVGGVANSNCWLTINVKGCV